MGTEEAWTDDILEKRRSAKTVSARCKSLRRLLIVWLLFQFLIRDSGWKGNLGILGLILGMSVNAVFLARLYFLPYEKPEPRKSALSRGKLYPFAVSFASLYF